MSTFIGQDGARTRDRRLRLLLSAAAAALALPAVPAFAEEQTDRPEASTNSADIVVTARRREERLTDVPVSANVLSGEALAAKGVARVDDLQTSTPSLKMTPAVGRRSNSQYELRGVTTVDSLITQDPVVGIYVNDVYRARATGTNQSFYDIANVQVLYGPQGTLFGRNSTGGAILITTNSPTDRFEGSVEAEYGNFNHWQFGGMINVPLSDKLQIRLAGQRSRSDGYVLNATTGNMLGGTNNWSGRASIHFKPTDSIDNQTVVSYYTADELTTPIVVRGFRATTAPNKYGQSAFLPANATLLAAVNATLAAEKASGYRVTYLDGVGASVPVPGGAPLTFVGLSGYGVDNQFLSAPEGFERPRNFSVTNTTTIDLSDQISLKNIFGFNSTQLSATGDFDGTPVNLVYSWLYTTVRQVSDEIQLSGEAGRLNWQVGGLYFREKGYDGQSAVNNINAYNKNDLYGINTSVGVYAQGSYKITDQLNFTAGARYTWDKRQVWWEINRLLPSGVGAIYANNGGFGVNLDALATCALKAGVPNNGPCGVALSKRFREPSWQVTLDYKPTQDTLIYVAHRHGYRAGGFNSRQQLTASAAQQLTVQIPFRPEKVNDVEIGFKGNFNVGDMSVRTSIALYQAWYTDIQKSVSQFLNNTGITIVKNSGKAKVKGLEATFGITPVEGVDISGSYGYVDGKYIDFPTPAAPTSNFPKIEPIVPFATAKHTLSTTVTLTPLDSPTAGRISLVTQYSYRSSFFADNALPSLNPEAHFPAQHNVNMSLNWDNIMGSPVSATAWVRNATDALQWLGGSDLSSSYGVGMGYVAPPRTFGLTLKYQFGQ